MLAHLFHLEPRNGVSLQQQLREQIASAIVNGHIPLNEPLPSGRKLANELNVARNTVVLAYSHLLDDGYLIARERRGYYVNPEILDGRVDTTRSKPEVTDPPNWDARLKLRPSERALKPQPSNWQQYPYPLIYGQFDPDLFPNLHWRECNRDASNVRAIREWASDAFTEDDPMLIDQIHTRLLPRRGVWANPDEILITVGAQQALYLICQLLLNASTKIGIEHPGYVDVHGIASIFTDNVTPMPIDEHGLIIDESLAALDVAYTTPSHQCPTTVTLPMERRKALLETARENQLLVIEDDYEAEINFASTPSPALKSIDRHDRVIYVGSLSKTLAPGLRIGFMVASKRFIDEARALRRLMLRHPPMNNQRALALFLARGYYDSLLRTQHIEYKKRWLIMRDCLQKYMPECIVNANSGGSSFWLHSPHRSSLDLYTSAKEHGILIENCDIHFFSEQRESQYFRIGLTSIATDRIEEAIKKLASLIYERGVS